MKPIPLIFLDVDGVLNDHQFDPEVMCGQIHRDKVGRLNRILRATGAGIVLSSAWRYIVHRSEANLMGMEWLFRSHGLLAGRLVGITRSDTMEPKEYDGRPGTWPVVNERGRQIADWLAESGQDHPYVVIDDLDLGISDAGHPFIRTDGKLGLTDDEADRAIELLSSLALKTTG